MRSASQSVLVALALLTAGLAGCATSLPQTEAQKTTPSSAVPQRPDADVNPTVQREFSGALRAMKLEHYAEAERGLLTLTRTHPELSGPYANLGIVYYRLGKMPEATEALKRATDINSDRASYYNQLGIVYRQSGQFDKARAAYDKALQIDPDYPGAHLNIGILYDLYLQNVPKALLHYERYQSLRQPADAQVSKWIVDLKRRGQTVGKNNRGE
jgi:Flp pilus assembly protein TadD